jgi:hypothetical protein
MCLRIGRLRMPNKKDKEINPDSFYKEASGEYDHSSKGKVIVTDRKNSAPITKDIDPVGIEPIPRIFNYKEYKEKENKRLEEIGADVRVYNKSSYGLLLSVLIGVIIIFGLFFVWGMATDKFVSDISCPSCNCERANLTCPSVNIPDCNCNQVLTCPAVNNSALLLAIDKLSNCSNYTI